MQGNKFIAYKMNMINKYIKIDKYRINLII